MTSDVDNEFLESFPKAFVKKQERNKFRQREIDSLCVRHTFIIPYESKNCYMSLELKV